MDFEDLERRIDHDTHAFILCNPHNPTGNVWSRSDLMTLGEICTRRRVVVLSDEIHCDFVTKGHTYTPYATLDDEAIVRNSVTYKSVSKSFNLSMMKCAYLFSTNPDYLDRIGGAGQHRQSMNTLAIIAAEAAYNEGEDWLDQLLEYIDGTQDLVESYVNANVPGVETVKPEGTYLAWLDVAAAMDNTRMKQAAEAAERPTTPEQAFQRFLVGPRPHPPEPGVQLRPGQRRPDADEHRHVAPARRAGAGQHGEGPGHRLTESAARRRTDAMVSLELVLDFLADSGIRATYKAVGEATGIFYRHLRSEPAVHQRGPPHGLGRPCQDRPAASGDPQTAPPDSELIRDGDDLARRATGARPPGPDGQPAPQLAQLAKLAKLARIADPGKEAGAKDRTLLLWLIAAFLALFLFLGS